MSYALDMSTPKPVQLEAEISEEAWRDYVTAVQHARLDAHVQRAYFERVRRFLGAANFAVQLVITLGSASAVATLLADAPVVASVTLAAIVAICSGVAQVMNLAEKVQHARDLVVGWTECARQLDQAWIYVRDSKYLGPLTELCDRTALVKVEEELGFPQIDRWAMAEHRRVIATDVFRESFA